MHYLLKEWKLRAFMILAFGFVLGGILLVEGVPSALYQWYTATVSNNENASSEESLPEAAVLTAAVAKAIPTIEQLRQYPHNWDDNPVAYLPEATALTSMDTQMIPTVEQLHQYPHNWDDNPVAYLPEASK